MEEELDGEVTADGSETIHVCPDPNHWGMLVSCVRRGFVFGPAFVPGTLVHTRISQFLDMIRSKENPTVAYEDSTTLPVRNKGGRVH